jgi:EmrB/QacA subfamily drug resistance transporter
MTVGNSNPLVRPVNTRAVFATVIAAVFVSNLDLFVVNVALPEIGRDFGGASLEALSWVLNAYAIVFAALLVVAGRLADRHGHRRGFILGLAVFTAGSVGCAASPGIGTLVVFRVIQAAGAAVLLPTSLALLLATTPPQRRAGAVRAWSAVGGVAAALGPVAGGLLTELDWRWVFLINFPVGVAALVASTRLLPDVRAQQASPPDAQVAGQLPDVLGAGLLAASVGAGSLALVRAGDWGWTSGGVIGSFAAMLALGAWFVARSARHPSPIVELPLLRTPSFGPATLAALLFTVAFAAMILSAALWTQHVWGYTALETGLALAPGPLMVPALAVGAGPLAARVGPGPVAALGTLLLGGGVLWWALALDTAPGYAADFLPGLLVGGVGVGLALPTLIAAATTSLPPHRLATGSGIVTTARQVGTVLGVAILVSLIGSPGTPAEALAAYQDGWLAIVITCGAAAIAALAIRRSSASVPTPGPASASVPVPGTRTAMAGTAATSGTPTGAATR